MNNFFTLITKQVKGYTTHDVPMTSKKKIGWT